MNDLKKCIAIAFCSIMLLIFLTGCSAAEPVTITLSPMPEDLPTLPPTLAVTLTEAQPTALPSEAQAARDYLAAAFDIIEANALNTDQVDWEELRETVFTRQAGVTEISEQYIQIKFLLTALNDNHSHFLTPEEADQIFWNAPIQQAPEPFGELIEDRYGYIWIGGFGSADPRVMNQYATHLQQIVKDLDAQAPCAWVLDLRDNNGGNLQQMIAGLGELIGDGLVAQGMNNKGKIVSQAFYRNGGYWSEGEAIAQAADADFELAHPGLPILVLIGPGTISSGEAVALAFKANPDAILIGHNTVGLTTGKDFFELSDGALIFLTVTKMMDPNGQVYGGVIAPDVLLEGSGFDTADRQTIPETVLSWLQENLACTDQ